MKQLYMEPEKRVFFLEDAEVFHRFDTEKLCWLC